MDLNPIGIMHSARKHIKQAMESTRMMQILKGDRMINGADQRQRHNHQVVPKNSYTTSSIDLIIAGSWKSFKQKGYAIAIASWIIMENNREVANEVQRVEALDACQVEMKTALLSLQHADSLRIRCVKVLTSYIGVVTAIRSYLLAGLS